MYQHLMDKVCRTILPRAKRNKDDLASDINRRLSELQARINVLERHIGHGTVSLSGESGDVLIGLNGDICVLPAGLVEYVCHTRVNDASEQIPLLLLETEHYLWCKSRLKPGDLALDVGANIGLFSVMMAKAVRYGNAGHVMALEASPTIYRDLLNVARVNGVSNIIAQQVAVTDKTGVVRFVDLQTGGVSREASHVAMEHEAVENSRNVVDVPAITLDELSVYHGGLRPRLIKIDVEGAEFLVLEGARKMIGECHPFLCIEIHSDDMGRFDHARLLNYLSQYDYRHVHRGKIYYCE